MHAARVTYLALLQVNGVDTVEVGVERGNFPVCGHTHFSPKTDRE